MYSASFLRYVGRTGAANCRSLRLYPSAGRARQPPVRHDVARTRHARLERRTGGGGGGFAPRRPPSTRGVRLCVSERRPTERRAVDILLGEPRRRVSAPRGGAKGAGACRRVPGGLPLEAAGRRQCRRTARLHAVRVHYAPADEADGTKGGRADRHVPRLRVHRLGNRGITGTRARGTGQGARGGVTHAFTAAPSRRRST